MSKASSIDIKGISWLWVGRIPQGAVTLVEGDPGTSKSTLTATMAAHVSRGADWPDGAPCPQGTVIMANAEDPEDIIITPRLMAAKANLDKVSILLPSSDTEEPFTIPDHVASLEKQILDWGVKLVVFDPLEAYLSGKTNNFSNHSMRQALRSLEHLAKRVNCSIIIVRHLNKDVGKASIYRGGGSIGIIGAARASMLVVRDPANKERCLVVPNKSNWSAIKDGIAYIPSTTYMLTKDGEEISTSKIVWDGECSLSANDVLQPSTDLAELTDLDDASTFLRNALKDGARYSGEVFSEGTNQGFSKKTIYRAAKMLDVIKRPEGEGKGQRWLWELLADVNSEFMEEMPDFEEAIDDHE